MHTVHIPMDSWSWKEVAAHLREEGLSDESVKAFEENEVDGVTLAALQKSELKDELGIKSLGDRKHVWAAIEKLRVESQAKAPGWPSSPATGVVTQAAPPVVTQAASPVVAQAAIRPSAESQDAPCVKRKVSITEPGDVDRKQLSAASVDECLRRRSSVSNSSAEDVLSWENDCLHALATELEHAKCDIKEIIMRSPILEQQRQRKASETSAEPRKPSLAGSLSKDTYRAILTEQANETAAASQSYEEHSKLMKNFGFRDN
ncbi:WD repeat [Diplonema papillatum]|nr:WD repeat [Diplonema papillatum]|eukprot:gene5547-8432_t